MTTLRLSVIALTLVVVGAAVALLLGLKRGSDGAYGLARSAGNAGRTVADDSAELIARSQDMVSEGGPAET